MTAAFQNLQENLEEQLAEIDPATLQYLDQLLAENPSTVQNIIENVLDETLSPPKPPPRPKRAKKRQQANNPESFSAENVPTTTIDSENVEGKFEDTESKGRRFIRWRFTRDLENYLTSKFMSKIRENIRTSFYIRHVYPYKLLNIEDNTVILFYTNHGSPWIKKLAESEKWLNEQETKRLQSDNIKRPSTKWKFLSFYNVDVKVVLDRQPLLGTGPLPDWLRNISRGRAGPMIALDTYQDNLCLWRCIAVHRGARIDRSTTAARILAKSLFKLAAVPNDVNKTSLDQLNDVEKHLNRGVAFSDWLGIRVY